MGSLVEIPIVNLDDYTYNENVTDSEESDDSDSETIDGKFVKINGIKADAIMGLEFNTEQEAYDFYANYGKSTGFAIRRDKVRRNSMKQIVARHFVCNKRGFRDKKHIENIHRKRNHRNLTRVGCKAYLLIKYSAEEGEDPKWKVTAFKEEHNHDLAPLAYVHLFPAYRGLTDADKAQVDSLQSDGMRTCDIMGYMVANKGGYESVGFTIKDLYNYFGKKMRFNIKDGDIVAALAYLQGKAMFDATLYSKHSISDGKLKSLFWADGCSRNDYIYFGDVVAFDTTYKKNKYNYPLVIFSGCNNHLETIIFGAALVSDETTETYKWVLDCFLDAMENRQPKGVMTDGDLAMREAIRMKFPDASHRLCAWHLHKNASENIKKPDFLKDFQKAMFSNFTPDEFEQFWGSLVEKNGLQNNKWVSKTYENKKLWATAYFRDKFFGRFRTTSQCEAINSLLRKFVRKKGSIFEFMKSYDKALRQYRNNEVTSNFSSNCSEPLLTTGLVSIEKDAAEIYTAKMFTEVKAQIVNSSALIATERIEDHHKLTFELTKTCDTNYHMKVEFDTATSTFICECRLFETRGIPCSHIFFVMKEEHVDKIPKSLILKRWTKNVKTTTPNDGKGLDTNMTELDRFGAYAAPANRLCKVAAESGAPVNEVMHDFLKLIEKYGKGRTQNSEVNKLIGDPTVIKTKGAPKKIKFSTKRPRQCSNCSSSKHNVRTCQTRILVDGSQMDNGDESDSTNLSAKRESQPKQKKAKDLNDINQPIRSQNLMSQLQPMNVGNFPNNTSQVQPNIHQPPQVQSNIHQPPQYLFGMPSTSNVSSFSELLQQVMNKGGQ